MRPAIVCISKERRGLVTKVNIPNDQRERANASTCATSPAGTFLSCTPRWGPTELPGPGRGKDSPLFFSSSSISRFKHRTGETGLLAFKGGFRRPVKIGPLPSSFLLTRVVGVKATTTFTVIQMRTTSRQPRCFTTTWWIIYPFVRVLIV